MSMFNNNAFLVSYITYECAYPGALEKSKFYWATGVARLSPWSENNFVSVLTNRRRAATMLYPLRVGALLALPMPFSSICIDIKFTDKG